MKKVSFFIGSWSLAAMLVLPAAALAADTATAGTSTLRERLGERREELKERLQEKRQNIVENFQAKREALVKRFGEKRLEKIQNFADRMFKRFEEAMDKLNKIADRIGARLDKLAARGVDITKWRADLDTAKTSIANAGSKLEEAKSKLLTALDAAKPLQSFKDTRSLVVSVRDALKKAHADLVKVIREIKKASPAEAGSTSTAPVVTP